MTPELRNTPEFLKAKLKAKAEELHQLEAVEAELRGQLERVSQQRLFTAGQVALLQELTQE